MPLGSFGIDQRVIDLLATQGITELYPPQEEGLKPALKGENLVLAMPTASGKSLVAYLAVLKSIMAGGKALYIVPLRALASEKYEDFKTFEPLGIRVGISVGDFDAPDPSLERFDVIIATSERADSLLRHRMHWLEKLTVVVADEVHLINDPDRGPTLEVTLSKLRQINPSAQIIALSATIKNSDEIAEWLDAVHVKSEWRPVPLKEGIYFDGTLEFTDGSKRELEHKLDPLPILVDDVLKDDGQALLFLNTRRSAEATARKLANTVRSHLDETELKDLQRLSATLLRRQEEPTSIGSRLASNIECGTAFHHAGLTNDQRKLVEESFKSGLIKCISATPTLAAGINLPARRVVVRDLRRFDSNFGFIPIPVLEIKQMMGRAGRPQYDKFGEAILVAKREGDRDFILEKYIYGEPETIESKLGSEPALRMHILASVATEHVRTVGELYKFMEKTFFAHRSEMWTLEQRIESVFEFLEREDFIVEEDGWLTPTLFGRRTSGLYIDPLSAVMLRDALSVGGKDLFAHLHAICATPDMPRLYLRRGDYEWVEEKSHQDFLLPYDDYEFFLAEVKTAALIEDWIEERPENLIVKKYGIGPGDIRRNMEMAEWLAYSMKELAKIFSKEKVQFLSELVLRIRYGVKRELLDLVSIRGVGRGRGRALFNRGYRSIEDLKRATVEELSSVPALGPAIARTIKRQLGEKIEEVQEEEIEGQSLLADFR